METVRNELGEITCTNVCFHKDGITFVLEPKLEEIWGAMRLLF